MSTTATRTSLALPAAQLLSAVAEGIALSTVVLHGVVHLAMGAVQVSLMMTIAAVAALVLAPLSGAVQDAIGLARSAAIASLLMSLALIGYALATTPMMLGASLVLFMVTQAIGGAARQGLAVHGVGDRHRLTTRATMHTLLNAGIGGGTVIGLLAISTGPLGTRLSFALGAGSCLLAALLVRRRPSRRAAAGPSRALLAFQDPHFTAATLLSMLLQLSMPILAVLIPVWAVTRTAAPSWIAAAALGVNAAVVILVQRPWSSRLGSLRATRGSCAITAAAFAIAAMLLAAAAHGTPAQAGALLIAGVLVLTIGEISGGAATWKIALDDVPPDAEGRYQSAFSLAGSGARVLGPLVALPLIGGLGGLGWILIGAVMAAAAGALVALAGPRAV